MRYTVRPISDRTAFRGVHTDSQFTMTWGQTIDLLGREIDMLAGHDVVLEVDVAESGIRLDGQLRSDARASSPAVRLAFESKHGPLTYATDQFIRGYARKGTVNGYVEKMGQDWQHNLLAIAKSLEALRLVDRYGVSRRGEQYAGWKQIGAGPIALGQGLGKAQAAAILERFAIGDDPAQARQTIDKLVAGTHADARRILREARAIAHPDRNDGDRKAWDSVEQAARVLGIAS